MTHDELLHALEYDTSTGIFTRRKSAGNVLKGSVLGTLDNKGYLIGMVNRKYVRLHRLAWFYVYKEWPTNQIDHIDGDKTNNRIANLRDCTTSENCVNQRSPRRNNSLCVQGVHQVKKTGRYRAKINIDGVTHHLGVFTTVEEASNAYQSFKQPHLPRIV